MSDYIRKSALIEQLTEWANRNETMGYLTSLDNVRECIGVVESQPTLDEKEIIRKHFYKVVNQLNGLMPIKFNGFGKTLITVEDVIKILKEECGISE